MLKVTKPPFELLNREIMHSIGVHLIGVQDEAVWLVAKAYWIGAFIISCLKFCLFLKYIQTRRKLRFSSILDWMSIKLWSIKIHPVWRNELFNRAVIVFYFIKFKDIFRNAQISFVLKQPGFCDICRAKFTWIIIYKFKTCHKSRNQRFT